ncbi:hypothetical protein K438DRAFT_1786580 [Mycena galopus ATCC 62051]|nr:hypothetical protein K438DRAFT_1786580 [Mycena galopus ATCC 62051]
MYASSGLFLSRKTSETLDCGVATEPGLEGNTIEAGMTTNVDNIGKEHSQRRLAAHGTVVGLSDGLISNSEVCMHVYALLEAAKEQGVPKTYVHFLGDGRHTAPTSATGYTSDVLSFMEKLEYGQLATVMGRYYVMDRDKRWDRCGWAGSDTLFLFNYCSDRMRKLVSVLGLPDWPMEVTVPKDLSPQCHSTTPNSHSTPQPMTNVLAEWLSKKDVKQARVADGFLFLLSPGALRIRGGLSPTISSITSTPCLSPPYLASIPLPLLRIPRILSGPPPSSYPGPHPHMLCVSADYSPPQSLPFYATFPFSPTFSMVLPPSFPANSTAQHPLLPSLYHDYPPPLHMSVLQTEKYAHVTFFFHGGIEKQFAGEEHFMIPSPKVATCDLYPEMAVQSVADKVAKIVESKEYDFVMCNFVPPDMDGVRVGGIRGGGGDSHFVHVHLRAEHVLEEWLADFEAQAQATSTPPSPTSPIPTPPSGPSPSVQYLLHPGSIQDTKFYLQRPQSLLVAYVDPRRVTAALEFPYFGFPDDRAKNPGRILSPLLVQKEKSFGIHSPAMAMAMARWNARNSSEDEYKLVTRSTVNDVEADQARRTPKRAASLPLVHEGSGLHRSSVPHHPCAHMRAWACPSARVTPAADAYGGRGRCRLTFSKAMLIASDVSQQTTHQIITHVYISHHSGQKLVTASVFVSTDPSALTRCAWAPGRERGKCGDLFFPQSLVLVASTVNSKSLQCTAEVPEPPLDAFLQASLDSSRVTSFLPLPTLVIPLTSYPKLYGSHSGVTFLLNPLGLSPRPQRIEGGLRRPLGRLEIRMVLENGIEGREEHQAMEEGARKETRVGSPSTHSVSGARYFPSMMEMTSTFADKKRPGLISAA